MLLFCRSIPKPDAVGIDFDDQNEENCDDILPLTNDGAAIIDVSKTQKSNHDDDIVVVLVVAII